jgi:cytochrome c1
MSLEQALAENTAALTRNSELLERVVAGQEAAIEKLNSGTTSRKRTPKADAAPAAEGATAEDTSGNATGAEAEAADTASGAGAATPAAEPTGVATIVAGITNEEQLKGYVSAWTGSTEDAAERGQRVELLKGMSAKLGVNPKFAELVPHTAKVVFFIERAKALGTPAVDVEAAYDFDGSPSQEVTPAATASDFD